MRIHISVTKCQGRWGRSRVLARSVVKYEGNSYTEVGVPVERNLTAGTVDAMFGVRGGRLRAAGALYEKI